MSLPNRLVGIIFVHARATLKTANPALLGSDTHFMTVRDTVPAGRAKGTMNLGSDPEIAVAVAARGPKSL
jgi:hypothetical protein